MEDMIDGVRDEVSSEGPNDLDSGDQEGPIAEADPNTGEILGENTRGVPDIPGGQDRSDAVAGDGPEDVAPADDGELDERARRLMEESGFNPDEELTILRSGPRTMRRWPASTLRSSAGMRRSPSPTRTWSLGA